MLNATNHASSTRTEPHPCVHMLGLTESEAVDARALAKYCLGVYGTVNASDFVTDAQVISHSLPISIRHHLNAARLNEQTHAVFISGNLIDQDELGATPTHWHKAQTLQSEVYAFLLSLYAALLGDIIGWASQQAGRLVTDVVPSIGYEQSLVSSSSDRELAWHTEDAFSPHRADWVGLLGLRNVAGVPTTVSYVDIREVPPDVFAVLVEPRFLVKPDPSHEFANEGPVAEPVKILYGPIDRPMLRIDRDFIRPRDHDPEAARAFAWIVEHVDRNLYDLAITAGDVCFLDNRNVVHGRRRFRARFDGQDRWLKRVNVVGDLRRTRSGRPTATTRVIN
jgi:Fe(II)/alpha-ketoglutarate-dependent arginine beta-hydroxylase